VNVRVRTIGFLLLAIGLLLGWGSRPSRSQLPAAAGDVGRPLNLTVSTSGPVSFKRQGWKIYVPIAFGTAVQFGDLLKVGDAARLMVVCSDLTLHDVPNGMSGVPCPATSGTQPEGKTSQLKATLRSPDGSLVNPTRGWRDDGSSPMVLSPRRTKLLSPLPVLRWTPVQGATNYSVMVRSFNLAWSATVTGATETFYPPTAPRLEPGIDYKLIVRAGDHSSELEPGIGLGFSIVSESERKTVEEEQRKIEALGLPPGPTLFLTAHLYSAHGLESDAISKLEVAMKISNEPEIARALGDCYGRAGLMRKAEEAYLKSLEWAATGTDEEGQMIAHLRLGNDIYGLTLRNKAAAELHLNAALALAREMGDGLIAAQAEKGLADLNPETHGQANEQTPTKAQL
jgi:hypothetical protein